MTFPCLFILSLSSTNVSLLILFKDVSLFLWSWHFSWLFNFLTTTLICRLPLVCSWVCLDFFHCCHPFSRLVFFTLTHTHTYWSTHFLHRENHWWHIWEKHCAFLVNSSLILHLSCDLSYSFAMIKSPIVLFSLFLLILCVHISETVFWVCACVSHPSFCLYPQWLHRDPIIQWCFGRMAPIIRYPLEAV